MEITPELQPTTTAMTPSRPKVKREVAPAPQDEIVERKDLQFLWKRGREKVRGRFVNDETPGEIKEFVTRFFKQDPVEQWKFKDGAIYEIPLIVAQHLNEDGRVPVYGPGKDEEGNYCEVVVGHKNRFHFESLEFTQIGGFGREPQLEHASATPRLRAGY